MDDSKIIINFGMSILFSSMNQVKILLEQEEPAAISEVVISGAETDGIGTMVLSPMKS